MRSSSPELSVRCTRGDAAPVVIKDDQAGWVIDIDLTMREIGTYLMVFARRIEGSPHLCFCSTWIPFRFTFENAEKVKKSINADTTLSQEFNTGTWSLLIFFL